jgi:Holliday junction resolvasome RuvABC endonuclease subunit
VPTKNLDSNPPSNKRVAVGIDQSLTGFAFTAIDVDDPTSYYCRVYKSPYFGVRRLYDIQMFLVDHLDYVTEQENEIVDLAMESTVLASHAALSMGELSAAVRLAIYTFYFEDDHRRFPLRIPPMTVKKYAAGKGNAKKQEMLLQIYKRWGIEFNDDNAADSYAIARMAAGIATGKIEEEVIAQIKDPKYRDQF